MKILKISKHFPNVLQVIAPGNALPLFWLKQNGISFNKI